jgi:hypothetical protein
MPSYPIYLAQKQPDVYQEFIRQSEEIAKAEGVAPWQAEHILVSDAGVLMIDVQSRDAAGGLAGFGIDWPPGTDVALIMTDGVEQVGTASIIDVVTQLAAIKSAREGTFIKRRIHRALNDFAKQGNRPVDDISVAALVAPAKQEA